MTLMNLQSTMYNPVNEGEKIWIVTVSALAAHVIREKEVPIGKTG